MDANHLKRTYGDRLTFWGGGVDTQKTLPFGTPPGGKSRSQGAPQDSFPRRRVRIQRDSQRTGKDTP